MANQTYFDPVTRRASSVQRHDLLAHLYLQSFSPHASLVDIRERLADLERRGT